MLATVANANNTNNKRMTSINPNMKPVIAKPFIFFLSPIAPNISAGIPRKGNNKPRTPQTSATIPQALVSELVVNKGSDSSITGKEAYKLML